MTGRGKADPAAAWADFAQDCSMLMAETMVVAPLRLMRIAGGGRSACEEASLMVTEKVAAQVTLAGALATGTLGTTPDRIASGIARHYLGYVRANRRRLTKVSPR